MGTCYYLYRPDNQTEYDLGKIGEWIRVFGDAEWTYAPGDQAALDDLSDALTRACEAGHWNLEQVDPAFEHFDGSVGPVSNRDYIRLVAADMIRWADDKPFRFISEHDREHDLAWKAFERTNQPNITGSRFTRASTNPHSRTAVGVRLGGIRVASPVCPSRECPCPECTVEYGAPDLG